MTKKVKFWIDLRWFNLLLYQYFYVSVLTVEPTDIYDASKKSEQYISFPFSIDIQRDIIRTLFEQNVSRLQHVFNIFFF